MEILGITLWVVTCIIVTFIIYRLKKDYTPVKEEALEGDSLVEKHLQKVKENHEKRLAENEHLKKIREQNKKTYKSLGRAELYGIKDAEERKAAEAYLKSLEN